MAAELGETTDPKELIPGEPERISQDLRALVGNIRTVDRTGGDLGRIDPAGWTGAGSNAFRDAFGAEPPKWANLVDTIGQGAQRLADYGDVLTWAQGQAQRAIELYTQAQAASRAAAAKYQEKLTTLGSGVIGPFLDPGLEAAQNAKSILENARQKLEQAGGAVAAALGLEPDGKGGFKLAGGEREFGAGNRKTKKVWDPQQGKWVEQDPGGWQKNRFGRSYQREFGDPASGLLGDRIEGTLKALGIDLPEKTWEAGASVDVAGGSIEGEFENGRFGGSGKLEGSVLGAGAEAHASVNPMGVKGGASAEAYLAKGSAEGELHYTDHAKISGSAEGIVGAKAEAEGSVGWTGAEASAEAFAGAKVSGEASAEVAGIGAGVSGEAWAGAGVEASGQFGMGEDGKFHVGASVGVALGVGGKVGFDVSIDPGEMIDTVTDVADDVGHAVADAADTVADAASDAAGAVADGAKKVWNSIF